MTNPILCRCCGKPVETRDAFPLHTACMRNHTAHSEGQRNSRCHEFRNVRTAIVYEKLPEDFAGPSMLELASMEFEPWFQHAKAVKRAGITRAGVFGAACPKCYRQIRYAPNLDYAETWCQCEGVYSDVRDENVAHGVPATHRRVYRNDPFTPV